MASHGTVYFFHLSGDYTEYHLCTCFLSVIRACTHSVRWATLQSYSHLNNMKNAINKRAAIFLHSFSWITSSLHWLVLAKGSLNNHANYIRAKYVLELTASHKRWINHAIHSFEKVIKNYARSKLLRHTEWLGPPSLSLSQLLKKQYDFLWTVRHKGPFQQTRLKRERRRWRKKIKRGKCWFFFFCCCCLKIYITDSLLSSTVTFTDHLVCIAYWSASNYRTKR